MSQMSIENAGEISPLSPLDEARLSYASSLVDLGNQRHPDVFHSYEKLEEATETYRSAFAAHLGSVALTEETSRGQETAEEIMGRRALLDRRMKKVDMHNRADMDAIFTGIGFMGAVVSIASERYTGLIGTGAVTSMALWRYRYKRQNDVARPEFQDIPLIAEAVANMREGDADETQCLKVLEATLHTERTAVVETVQQLRRVRSFTPNTYVSLAVNRVRARRRRGSSTG